MCCPIKTRRHLLAALAGWPLATLVARGAGVDAHPDARWFSLAEDMKRLAESWGDQSYGAVLVIEGEVVGFGPSRVVKDGNSDAHAERVALRDAQARLGRASLAGAVLYSTSRPCSLCEAAAADAQVSRMYFGASLQDGGRPRGRQG
ncbi:hypothetical protein GCM10027034_01760 [Ramlibacter solisilvae]